MAVGVVQNLTKCSCMAVVVMLLVLVPRLITVSCWSGKPHFVYTSGAMVSLVQEEVCLIKIPDTNQWIERKLRPEFDVPPDAWHITGGGVDPVTMAIFEFNDTLWLWLYYEPWEPMLLFSTALFVWMRAPVANRLSLT